MDESKMPMISNQFYDILKWIAQIFLPAVGALYYGLAEIWGLPKGGEVVGTITVIDAFLGVLLGISTLQYNRSEAKYDGHINIEDRIDKKVFSLDLNDEPESLENKDEALFKVNKPPSDGVAE